MISSTQHFDDLITLPFMANVEYRFAPGGKIGDYRAYWTPNFIDCTAGLYRYMRDNRTEEEEASGDTVMPVGQRNWPQQMDYSIYFDPTQWGKNRIFFLRKMTVTMCCSSAISDDNFLDGSALKRGLIGILQRRNQLEEEPFLTKMFVPKPGVPDQAWYTAIKTNSDFMNFGFKDTLSKTRQKETIKVGAVISAVTSMGMNIKSIVKTETKAAGKRQLVMTVPHDLLIDSFIFKSGDKISIRVFEPLLWIYHQRFFWGASGLLPLRVAAVFKKLGAKLFGLGGCAQYMDIKAQFGVKTLSGMKPAIRYQEQQVGADTTELADLLKNAEVNEVLEALAELEED
mmetsp:Transcript_22146/g.10539  ORF Transcript_22146/g.10539 Transcript_22146/m.10539 type:complete len:342 (+) Transcript_22146:4687-5712(+)